MSFFRALTKMRRNKVKKVMSQPAMRTSLKGWSSTVLLQRWIIEVLFGGTTNSHCAANPRNNVLMKMDSIGSTQQ